MPTLTIHTTHRLLGWATASIGLLCLTVVGVGYLQQGSSEAWLVKRQQAYTWKVISAPEILSGALIPANTHTVFHLPEGFTTIKREILLGHKGKNTRYWGYCFPANYDPKTIVTRTGFPGLIFLSEKERAVRAAALARAREPFSITNLPSSEQEVKEMTQRPSTAIRHQLEIFKPNTMCYIMSETSLAIGLDFDGDKLNDKLERALRTDIQSSDSDADGIIDGVEYLTGTNPAIRDTDGDSLVDGIEDADWDGHIDPGETDPRTWDTDRDGLCDGSCRIKLQNTFYYIGEDANLNGEVDEGELDPLLIDTDGDGTGDQVQYYQCIASGAATCP